MLLRLWDVLWPRDGHFEAWETCASVGGMAASCSGGRQKRGVDAGGLRGRRGLAGVEERVGEVFDEALAAVGTVGWVSDVSVHDDMLRRCVS